MRVGEKANVEEESAVCFAGETLETAAVAAV
jgi:hypothetical protein